VGAPPRLRRGLRVEPGGQLVEGGPGLAGGAAAVALGQAGVVAGQAVVGFGDLAGPRGEAGEPGAGDELHLQVAERAGGLDRFEEQALHLGGRSLLQIEEYECSRKARPTVVDPLPGSLVDGRGPVEQLVRSFRLAAMR